MHPVFQCKKKALPFIPVHNVQCLTLAILVPVEMVCRVHSCTYSYSSYSQPNTLQLCASVPWMPCRRLLHSWGTKQMESLCKPEASLWSWFHLEISISPGKMCTYRRSKSDSFCKAGIEFVVANKPTWFTFAWFSCFTHSLFSCSSLCNVSSMNLLRKGTGLHAEQ